MSYVFCFNAQQDPHVPHELTNYYVVNNTIELTSALQINADR